MDKILNILERIIALVLVVLFSPLFLITMILIFVNLQAFPIFSQYRMGRWGEKFRIYKFRTLKKNTPSNIPTDEILDYSEYSTRFCLMIRALSIDELPQLINIIRGEMSFVGPRPVMLNEEILNQKRLESGVYSIRPGLTGWSQINGRDLLDVNDKVEHDIYYVNNKSLKFDLYIIWKTVFKVIYRENIKGFGKQPKNPSELEKIKISNKNGA